MENPNVLMIYLLCEEYKYSCTGCIAARHAAPCTNVSKAILPVKSNQ